MTCTKQKNLELLKKELNSHLTEFYKVVKESMPTKGDSINNCQRTYLLSEINSLSYAVNGITLADLEPNTNKGRA